MLSVILKILSTLGILFLCLLGLAILLILLVLFFPVQYKVTGRKDPEETTVRARASWLFGFLRLRYDYPEPGRILVKVLPFTVYDSGGAGKKEKGDPAEEGNQTGEEREKDNRQEHSTGAGRDQKTDADRPADAGRNQKPDAEHSAGAGREQMPDTDQPSGAGREQKLEAEQAGALTQEGVQTAPEDAQIKTDSEKQDNGNEEQESADPSILKKIRKIKYTIRGIYDKIKNIWENISYYTELLREEETKLLFSHVVFRVGRIWEDIRPRRIRGQVLFGMGSPDTTGYAYGVYGMLSPFLGNKLLVTPDFTRAVLEGDVYISGHITLFAILWNGLKVLLDKKLKRFINKMKAGRKK